MRQETRDKIVFWGFIIVKVILFARTGLDTWIVSRDVINVLLIDGVFVGMWLAAAYGGKSETAMAMRPFAAAGAWLTYVSMIAIGWQAHHDVVSIAARIAGGVALAYDTWDMVVMAAQRVRIRKASKTFDQYADEIDEREIRKTYAKAMRGTQSTELQRASDAIAMLRIRGYAQRNLALPPGTPNSGYTLLESGQVQCEDCGWTSPNTYETLRKAQPVYAAHTRSAVHRARVARIIDVEQ